MGECVQCVCGLCVHVRVCLLCMYVYVRMYVIRMYVYVRVCVCFVDVCPNSVSREVYCVLVSPQAIHDWQLNHCPGWSACLPSCTLMEILHLHRRRNVAVIHPPDNRQAHTYYQLSNTDTYLLEIFTASSHEKSVLSIRCSLNLVDISLKCHIFHVQIKSQPSWNPAFPKHSAFV